MQEQQYYTETRKIGLKDDFRGKTVGRWFNKELKKYPGAKAVGAKIEYGFRYRLDLTLKTRKLEKRKSDLPPQVPAEKVDIWKVVEESREGDFEERLSNTCYTEQCEDCHGAGHLECPTCHGKGECECDECHGLKPHKCWKCAGKGSVWKDCYWCSGRGRNDCRSCDGSGSVTCPECNGSGRCLYDGPYGALCSKSCTTCKGLGRLTCPSCNGEGSKVCSYCGGRGGENHRCGVCDGVGELYHCDECHDTGIVTCSKCGGERLIHCKKCGDIGSLTWVYYLLQQEHEESIVSCSNRANCRQEVILEAYEKCSREAVEEMKYDISDWKSITQIQMPKLSVLRVMRAYESIITGTKLVQYDDEEINAVEDLIEKSKENICGVTETRTCKGRLTVTRLVCYLVLLFKWRGKEYHLYCKPYPYSVSSGGVRLKRPWLPWSTAVTIAGWDYPASYIESRGLAAAFSDFNRHRACVRERNQKIRGRLLYAVAVPVWVLAVYIFSVYCHWVDQPLVTRGISWFEEWAMHCQIWMANNFPAVFNFWNWPAVLSLVSLCFGWPFLWGFVRRYFEWKDVRMVLYLGVPYILGFPVASLLAVALPFVDGISWWLAILIDIILVFAGGRFLWGWLVDIGNPRCKKSVYVVSIVVTIAIMYVIAHFFSL